MAAPEPGSELELISAVADALDGALTQIDQRPGLAPVSQLAVIGVGVLRAVAPLIRAERDRMAAEVAGGKS